MQTTRDEIVVQGAGPAGLSAAITLASRGRRVTVYEKNPDCGMRFRGDFQGFENWSSTKDIFDTLHELEIATDFWYHPVFSAHFFDYRRRERVMYFERPALYIVKRGLVPDSLDLALKQQARAKGVNLVFNTKVSTKEADIIASGPSRADGIVRGITFQTSFTHEPVMILDDGLAPKTFAYLLIFEGRGCLGTGLTTNFNRADEYLDKTIEAFTDLYHLEIQNPKRFTGYGNYAIRKRYFEDGKYVIGEAAGLQDYMFAFGLRQAIVSGHLAAQSILENKSYDALMKQTLVPQLKISLVNRFLFSMLGSRGYSRLLERGRKIENPLRQANKIYNPRGIHSTLLPLARLAYKK